jgi:aspartyl-tRNA(Asn)/glutamyl-tRNA(Gln) amidotransferase subunit A
VTPHNRREFLKSAAAAWAASTAWSSAGAAAQTPVAGDDLAWLPLSEVSTLVRERKVSSVEITRACLARIERLNARLNAFITVTAEQALRDAKIADADIAQKEWRGPLHGIPVALKDLIDTAGVRTTAGSAVFADRVPRADAEVVLRLKNAGAVILGKLNMHEFAYGDSSAQSHFGPVRNPWSLDRVPGGSSGGSAAAVAAGMCYAALGSDTGGSIRQPAAYCGIVGLKPTYGLVSTRGVVPLSWSLDHVGPMCRTVFDAALALQPIAGYDALDSNSVPAIPPDYATAVRGRTPALRLGVPRPVFYENLDPEIERAVTEALRVLRGLSVSMQDYPLPPYRTLPIVAAEAYTYHAQYFSKTPDRYQPMTRRRLEAGSRVSATAYIEGKRELDRLRRAVLGVFQTVDLLITPTTPVLPALVQEAAADSGTPPPGGVALSLRNTQPFDIFGLPTVSLPCGFSRSGLPIGLSISGPPLGEGMVLALAYAYERATEWHRRRPML